MRIVAVFDPATETSTTFNAGFSNGQGRIIVYNESNYNLQLGWDAFSTYCPAWTAMLYCISSNSVQINWSIQSTLSTTATPPISQVVIEALDTNEPVTGTYPAPLVRQTNIGNAVNTSVTSTNSIVNDGNPSGTSVVESTTSSKQTALGTNDGLWTLSTLIAGALHQFLKTNASGNLLQLGNATDIVEVLGALQVDGTLQSAATLNLVYNVLTGFSHQFEVAGVKAVQIDVNGVNIASGKILKTTGAVILDASGADTSVNVSGATNAVHLQSPAGTDVATFAYNQISFSQGLQMLGGHIIQFNIGQIKDLNQGTVAASGTVNHGLSGAPASVLMTPDVAASTWTFSAASYTTTQFTATLNSALTTRWTAYR